MLDGQKRLSPDDATEEMMKKLSHGNASKIRRALGPTVAVAVAAISVAPVLLSEAPLSHDRARLAGAYGQVPLTFEANAGQTDPQVAFLARGAGYALFLTPGEAVLSLRPSAPSGKPAGPNRAQVAEASSPAVLRLRCRGANPSPRVTGLDPQAARSNYFIGNDRSRWRTGVPHFGKVRYEEVYPGIDLVYYGRQRQLEFDFVVQPGADPRQIGLDFEGAGRIETDAGGDLIVHIAGGAVRQHKPVAYQERDGARETVAASYALAGERGAAFRLGDYDPSRPLVIDPFLEYSTYLGGTGGDEGHGIAVDSSGNAYVVGRTISTDFPTEPLGSRIGLGGGWDVFVTKLNVAGTALVYSTYLGGSGDDSGYGIAVDSSGYAYVTGSTASFDFPTQNEYQTDRPGTDAFVTKLDAAGAALVYSTYLGGGIAGPPFTDEEDEGRGIAVDSSGSAYVTGWTDSTNFPTQNAAYPDQRGRDAFVTKLEPSGNQLAYSTYLGGSLPTVAPNDEGRGIAVDAFGYAYVTGRTDSWDFPTTPGLPTDLNAADAFVTKLAQSGSTLVYSSYVGTTNADEAYGIAVDDSRNAYVTGYTAGSVFVAKLNASGEASYFDQTILGGGSGWGHAIAVDRVGSAYVTGTTYSITIPMVNPILGQGYHSDGTTHAFVAKLYPWGSPPALEYSTYLGGSNPDNGRGIAVDSSGNAYVTGWTSSTNFPTAPDPPYQGANRGGTDAFVAKISPRPPSDFDGDGQTDIVWQYQPATGPWPVRFWLMDGLALKQPGGEVFLSDLPNGLELVAVGDFGWCNPATGVVDSTPDGKLDLVFRPTPPLANGPNQTWYMDGTQVVSENCKVNHSYTRLPAQRVMTAGDFGSYSPIGGGPGGTYLPTLDGRPDLVWQNVNSFNANLDVMEGVTREATTLFSPANAGSDWHLVGAANVGSTEPPPVPSQADLVWQNHSKDPTNGQMKVWYMTGNAVESGGVALVNDGPPPLGTDGYFVSPDTTIPAAEWRLVGIGDFNGDGKPDLLFRHTEGTAPSGRLWVWLMDGRNRIDEGTGLSPAVEADLNWKIVAPR